MLFLTREKFAPFLNIATMEKKKPEVFSMEELVYM